MFNAIGNVCVGETELIAMTGSGANQAPGRDSRNAHNAEAEKRISVVSQAPIRPL